MIYDLKIINIGLLYYISAAKKVNMIKPITELNNLYVVLFSSAQNVELLYSIRLNAVWR